MNYFFSACFLLIPKIIQLAISLARILAYFFLMRLGYVYLIYGCPIVSCQ
jgi:hypothetical protein